MIRYLIVSLALGLGLGYCALAMAGGGHGTYLPAVLFFGPWLGSIRVAAKYSRQIQSVPFIVAPLLYVIYGVVLKLSAKRGRISITTLLIFLAHYSGVMFSAQTMRIGGGEPRNFLLVMKNHPVIMGAGFALFIAANLVAIMNAWIARE